MKLLFDYIRCIWYNKLTLIGYIFLLFPLIIHSDYTLLIYLLGLYLLLITLFGAETLSSYYLSLNLLKKNKGNFIPKYTFYCNVVGLTMAKRELEGKYF